nr:GNAT family N-acetyltransferase [Deinobacterium chartae]
MIGHVYAGPYATLEPELAFVLEDAQGVCGYVIGVLDTEAFNARCEREWWPPLRERYPLPATPPEQYTPDERMIARIHKGWDLKPASLDDYPSHLHIDLLARAQGGGNGRAMMETLLGALEQRGSRGVHLGVGARNERAVSFYRSVGFTELHRSPLSVTFGMRFPR